MAEAAGLVLSAVSLIALFTTAVDGYKLVSAAHNELPNDAHFVVTKLEIEKHRFSVWGKFMGLSNDDRCKEFAQQSKPTQHLCVAVLTEVASIIRDAETLSKKYGLVELKNVKEWKPEDVKTRDDDNPAQSEAVNRLHESLKQQTGGIGMGKKWKWAIKDGEKFGKLVDKLCYLNDSLENSLTPFNIRQLTKALPTFVIPSIDDTRTLSILAGSSNGYQSVLTTTADLKRLNIEAEASEKNDPKALFHVENIPLEALQVFDQGSRSMAIYSIAPGQEIRVIVEWKELGPEVQDKNRTLVQNRVQALAHLLSTHTSADFCILRCLGLVQESSGEDNAVLKYGFVFALPSPDTEPITLPVTLLDLLESKDPQTIPSLGDRFNLAKGLASTLALLHATQWLHKGLKSDNILFFRLKNQHSKSPTSITSPYLAGFEIARRDAPEEESGPLSKALDSEDNLYRHPHVRGPIREYRYIKEHDIYSLGVLLYEIGLWNSVQNEIKVRPKASPDEFTKSLINNCGELEWRMGKKYHDVVVRCLKTDFGLKDDQKKSVDGAKLQAAFWFKVVKELDECHA